MQRSATSDATGPAALVLAAGLGTRLAALTRWVPKALCPVGGRTLLDHTLDRVASLGGPVTVNAHHHAPQVVAHLGARHPGVGIQEERDEALGTAGAVGRWAVDHGPADLVVVNADAWTDASLAVLVERWDRVRIGALVVGGDDLGPGTRLAGLALPATVVADQPDRPAGLWETALAAARRDGRLQVVRVEGAFVDCGTPARYLQANRLAVAGSSDPRGWVHPTAHVAHQARISASVVDRGCDVHGDLTGAVCWPGTAVARGEALRDAVRTPHGTVLVR